MERRFAFAGGLSSVAGSAVFRNAPSLAEVAPTPSTVRLSFEEPARRTARRRAVDAGIPRAPLVGEDAVKQACFRVGGANCNDIVWRPNGGGRMSRSPLPIAETRDVP